MRVDGWMSEHNGRHGGSERTEDQGFEQNREEWRVENLSEKLLAQLPMLKSYKAHCSHPHATSTI